jgi:hypothetical protein
MLSDIGTMSVTGKLGASLLWRDVHFQKNKNNMHCMLLNILREEEHLPPQGSEEWLHIRHKLITASVAADILGTKKSLFEAVKLRCRAMDQIEIKIGRNYRSKHAVMEQKITHTAAPMRTAKYITDMGQLCEHVIRDNVERAHWMANPLDLYTPLKFRISREGFLGASPDGAFSSPLRLLEIKTLIYRKMVPRQLEHKYYVQCQVQMHCYGILQAEYCEARVSFISTYGEWKYGDYAGDRGLILRDKGGGIHTCPLNMDYQTYHDEIAVNL